MITASVVDSFGNRGSASITVTIANNHPPGDYDMFSQQITGLC